MGDRHSELEVIDGKIARKYTSSLFYEISLTAKYTKKVGEQHFKKLNLEITIEEFCVLDIIYYEEEEICQRDLALRLLINRANMGKILDSLEKKGYIKRLVTTKSNRPVKLVSLTKLGEDIYINTVKTLRVSVDKMTRLISKEESDTIIESLKKIRKAVKETIEIDI